MIIYQIHAMTAAPKQAKQAPKGATSIARNIGHNTIGSAIHKKPTNVGIPKQNTK